MSILLGNNRIGELKAELRKTVLKRNRAVDSFSGDCGVELTKVFRPEVGILEARANEILDELAKLDPECPKFRYSV